MSMPQYAARCLLLITTVMLYQYLAGQSGVLHSDAWLVVNLGAAVSLAGLLLLPASRQWSQLLLNSIAGVSIFLLLLAVFAKGSIPYSILPQSGLAVFSIIFLLHSLIGLLRGLRVTEGVAAQIVLLIALLTGSSVLWLGPPVELFVLGDGAINTIIASSPLSYLSVAAEYDYLRSEWFYRHTPFGSLRFTYPNQYVLTAIYLVLAIGAQSLLLWLTHMQQQDP